MVKLRITWTYCLAFYCVVMLYVSLHELVHHVAGFLICGDWGYKSFNYFKTACDDTDKTRLLATYAGPVFTYIVMWVGAWFLRPGQSTYRKHLGFALIFAQMPLQRMTSPLLRSGEVALGAEVTVPTLDGRATLRIPAGSQPGSRLRLRGKGAPAFGGKPAGDLLVTLRVQVPRAPGPAERAAVEALAEFEDDDLRAGLLPPFHADARAA